MAQANAGPVMVQEPADVPAVNGTHGQPAANTIPKSNADATSGASNDTNDTNDDDEWESASLYDDILAQQEGIEYSTDTAQICTPEEARQIRQRLHEVGVSKFVFEYITSERYSARKMCTAFNMRLPKAMDDFPDKAFYRLLGKAISQELNMRCRLKQYATIDDAAALLQDRRNIMVITGAGISTSLGIPDFRSKNTGFYSKLRDMGIEEPEEVFSIYNFDEDPSTFYKLAGEIVPDLKKWSPTHEFIRLLQDKDKLLTNYTQNIDNVESHAGIRRDKLIQCHGSWAMATCRKCKHQVPGEDIFPAVKEGIPAQCKQCVYNIATRKPGMKRKRSSNGSKKRRQAGDDDSDSDGAYDLPQPGIMKPDITFFGEALPEDFYERLKYQDRDQVDLLIVIGTSMKVAPVSEIPQFVPKDVPQIYISRDPITHINFDINLLGDCDVVVAELARRAGWTLNHKMIPPGQQVDVLPVDEPEHIYRVIPRATTSENEASAA